MRASLFLFPLVATIGACALTPEEYRSLDGVSDESRIRMFSACKMGTNGKPGMSVTTRSYMDDCMRASGFVRQN